MKCSLPAATAMLLIGTAAASAFDLKCGAAQIALGDDPRDRNPVIGVTVSYDPHLRAWGVMHMFRDGSTISRNTQYGMRDASEDGRKVQWKGTLFRQPVLWMIGEVRREGEAITYYEWLYNSAKGNLLLMHSAARCQRVNPIPSPTAQTPATQPYAQAPTQPYAYAPAPSIPPPSSHPPPVRTPPYAYQAPAPQAQAPAPTQEPSGKPVTAIKDSVPIYTDSGGNRIMIDVLMGGQIVRMVVDTGATHGTVTESVGLSLMASGHAKVIGEADVELADGSKKVEKVLLIRELRIGQHTIRDAHLSVSTSSTMLIGFGIINGIAPFTIDTRAGELVFHTTRG